MGLKVELKGGERFILGDCLVTNGKQRTRLIQLMYTARDPRLHHETYFILMRDLVQAAPSAWAHIVAVSNHILAGEMYKALKSAKALGIAAPPSIKPRTAALFLGIERARSVEGKTTP